MGNDRFIFNRVGARFNPKSANVSIRVVSKNDDLKIVIKSQLVKRSSDDLKKSRVSAYSFLIP